MLVKIKKEKKKVNVKPKVVPIVAISISLK